jgi:hypothetical protein
MLQLRPASQLAPLVDWPAPHKLSPSPPFPLRPACQQPGKPLPTSPPLCSPPSLMLAAPQVPGAERGAAGPPGHGRCGCWLAAVAVAEATQQVSGAGRGFDGSHSCTWAAPLTGSWTLPLLLLALPGCLSQTLLPCRCHAQAIAVPPSSAPQASPAPACWSGCGAARRRWPTWDSSSPARPSPWPPGEFL